MFPLPRFLVTTGRKHFWARGDLCRPLFASVTGWESTPRYIDVWFCLVILILVWLFCFLILFLMWEEFELPKSFWQFRMVTRTASSKRLNAAFSQATL